MGKRHQKRRMLPPRRTPARLPVRMSAGSPSLAVALSFLTENDRYHRNGGDPDKALERNFWAGRIVRSAAETALNILLGMLEDGVCPPEFKRPIHELIDILETDGDKARNGVVFQPSRDNMFIPKNPPAFEDIEEIAFITGGGADTEDGETSDEDEEFEP